MIEIIVVFLIWGVVCYMIGYNRARHIALYAVDLALSVFENALDGIVTRSQMEEISKKFIKQLSELEDKTKTWGNCNPKN